MLIFFGFQMSLVILLIFVKIFLITIVLFFLIELLKVFSSCTSLRFYIFDLFLFFLFLFCWYMTTTFYGGRDMFGQLSQSSICVSSFLILK